MLWDWFLRELETADGQRRERLRAVRTPADLANLRQKVRRHLLEAIGGFPERTPLNARQTGVLKRDGYVIEKVVFESRPRHFVTANLYLPERMNSLRPAVIESCGHYMEGKAAPDYQRVCAGLARKGFVALVFDPVGQGERLMYRGLVKSASGTTEHVVAGKPCYLVGRTLAHFRIWDAIRALDYLESRPEVDRTRLGMLGHSGGGMMTLLTAPLEERLKAVMSCCAVTTFYHKTRARLIADPEQIVPGVYAAGIDHPELIASVAPRAFLIGAVTKDYVPLGGTRRTFEEVKPLFEAGRVGLVETPGEHMLNRGLREACYGWMQKHLGVEGDTREPELPVETADALRCTPSGCVMDLAGARSVFDLNREYAGELAKRRKVALPAFKPRRDAGIELVVVGQALSPARQNLIMLIGPRRDPTLANELAQSGVAVMEVDLRGWGETTPVMPGSKPGFAWEDFFAYRAIEMGRSLAAMRVQDLLAAVQDARRQYRRIYVVGVEGGGVIALHAAAAAEEIAGVAVVAGLGSYGEVMQTPVSHEPVSSFLPGALLHYDLPDLVARIRPRPFLALAKADARDILHALK
jgi:dienelactone hydrolase